jgi:hypothetical protein
LAILAARSTSRCELAIRTTCRRNNKLYNEGIKIVKEEFNMNVKALLGDEIKEETEFLKAIGVGTDDHKLATDDLTKLVDRYVDLEKLDIEREEIKLKIAQMEEDKKDRWIKNCLSAAGIIIPVGVTIWGTLKSFKFEQEGTITTIMGRGFINKLLPKK